jgi:hypothetical protein
MGKWMQAAAKRMEAKGTAGSLTRIAKRAGHKTALGYCNAGGDKKYPQKCNFARNAAKSKHGKKK